MRTVLSVVIVALTFFFGAEALEAQRLTSVTVGSGESAMVSGLSGIVTFETESNRYLEVAVMQEIAWAAYGPQLSGSLDGFVAMSVGHMFGELWFGPYLFVSRETETCRAGVMYWPAIFLQSPAQFETDSRTGHVVTVSYTCGILTASATANKFLDGALNSLPGLSVSVPLPEENMSFSGSATWNTNQRKVMWYLGVTWSPE